MGNSDYKKILNERKRAQKYSTFNTPAFAIILIVFLILLALGYSVLGI